MASYAVPLSLDKELLPDGFVDLSGQGTFVEDCYARYDVFLAMHSVARADDAKRRWCSVRERD